MRPPSLYFIRNKVAFHTSFGPIFMITPSVLFLFCLFILFLFLFLSLGELLHNLTLINSQEGSWIYMNSCWIMESIVVCGFLFYFYSFYFMRYPSLIWEASKYQETPKLSGLHTRERMHFSLNIFLTKGANQRVTWVPPLQCPHLLER